jgi:hypothetical protein
MPQKPSGPSQSDVRRRLKEHTRDDTAPYGRLHNDLYFQDRSSSQSPQQRDLFLHPSSLFPDQTHPPSPVSSNNEATFFSPTGTLSDPSNLLEQYQNYSGSLFELLLAPIDPSTSFHRNEATVHSPDIPGTGSEQLDSQAPFYGDVTGSPVISKETTNSLDLLANRDFSEQLNDNGPPHSNITSSSFFASESSYDQSQYLPSSSDLSASLHSQISMNPFLEHLAPKEKTPGITSSEISEDEKAFLADMGLAIDHLGQFRPASEQNDKNNRSDSSLSLSMETSHENTATAEQSKVIRYANIDEAKLQTLTGLTKTEFNNLEELFRGRYEQHRESRGYQTRDKRSLLPTSQDRLLFILIYAKTYNQHFYQEKLFDTSSATVGQWVRALQPVLEKTLCDLDLTNTQPGYLRNLAQTYR